MSYFSAVRNAFRLPDLRRRLLITGFLLLVYKLLTIIPVPGITPAMIEQARNSEIAGTTAFQAFNVLSGGALANLSIVALSIYPFLAAVELINNFIPIIPRLRQIAREPGAEDNLRTLAARLTIPLAIFSAVIGEDIALPLLDVERADFLSGLTVVAALTAGTFITFWIAQMIDSDGLGAGIPLIVYTNIIGEVPTFFANAEAWGPIKAVIIVLVLIVLVIVMIMLQQGVRRIPVQYGKRVRGRKSYGGSNLGIPVALMPANLSTIESGYGLMVIISAVLLYLLDTFPSPVMESISAGFLNVWPWLLFFLVLITTFRAMGARAQEENIAVRLQQNGGFIPGVRPGKRTEDYIRTVELRLAGVTAPFLAFLSVLPWLLQWLFELKEPAYLVLVLWVSIRIVVDFHRQLEAKLMMRNYEGFLR
ncbi:MAG: hypothetical protein KJ065_16255 [Anaerolineae bacterium]|nr:hypothetical protein [Anaerolineae bacterium]